MTPTNPTCCAQVAKDRTEFRTLYGFCSRSAKVVRNGKWYCGQRDPEAMRARALKREEKWKAEWAEEARLHRLHNAAPDLLEALKQARQEIVDFGNLSVTIEVKS